MAAEKTTVVGIVAAYRRPQMLRSLLASLDPGAVRKMIVVDNGADPATEEVCREAPMPVQYHRPEDNLGCGGGVARGLSLGLREPGVTHFCVLDDDAEAEPGAVPALIAGMDSVGADVAVPLVLNRDGHITWFPGLQEPHAWEVIRRPGLKPADYLELCGPGPVPFTWAPWPMIAVTASAVRECGFPRDDFWLCAEDLEYTLRLTYRYKGVMVPTSACRHLPPPSSSGDEIGGPHYLRFCLMLQNLCYICTRLPHGRRARRHLPGNYRRFMRIFGFNGATMRDAHLAFWRGAVLGKPAGSAGADGFKQRFIGFYREGVAASLS